MEVLAVKSSSEVMDMLRLARSSSLVEGKDKTAVAVLKTLEWVMEE